MKIIQIVSLTAGVALLAGCTTYRETMGYSKEVSFQQLPQPAQQTVRQEIGSRQITKINQDTKNGQVAYRVQVQNDPGGLYFSKPVLWVSPSGEILKESNRLANKQGTINEPAGAQIQEPAGAQPQPAGPGVSTVPDPGSNNDSIRTDPDFQ